MLLPGTFFAYMGQELAIDRRPSLFDKDAIDLASGDPVFREWFGNAHLATKAIRAREVNVAAREIAAGVVLVEWTGGVRAVSAIINLDGRSGKLSLPHPVSGRELLSGRALELEATIDMPGEPMVVELDGR
jgi:hypothetical protein